MSNKITEFMLLVFLGTVGLFALGSYAQDLNIPFKVLYNFSGGSDGCCLAGGLARDAAGNLYGVASASNGGAGSGDLFMLAYSNGHYQFRVLHSFNGQDGRTCQTTPTVDGAGNIFGVCGQGGGVDQGTLWVYTHAGKFIHLFSFGASNGTMPQDRVAADNKGNIYGTAYTSGPGNSGTLWQYSTTQSSFTILHSFQDRDDGGILSSGPLLDQNGVLWGTTDFGPSCYYCGDGTAWNYDLSTGTFTTFLDFDSTGVRSPQSHFTIDKQGNLFGSAYAPPGGLGCGLIYELPKDNNYQPVVIDEYSGDFAPCNPDGGLTFDKRGNLLGVTSNGGQYGYGVVFGLVPSNGAWQQTILHTFDGTDGRTPEGGLVTDGQGRWFGTASLGGQNKWGTVYGFAGVP